MASRERAVRDLIEKRDNGFRQAESEAARALLCAGLFRDIDARILASDVHFSAPKFLPLDALAERARAPNPFDGIQRLDWRRRDRDAIAATDLLIEAGKFARPATLAGLSESGQLASFLQAHQYKLCVLAGTGLIDSKGKFHYLVIDFVHPENDFEHDEGEDVGPILRAVDTDIEQLRSAFYSVALFTGSRPSLPRR